MQNDTDTVNNSPRDITIDEYASGLSQATLDIERQTMAYAAIRRALAVIAAIIETPTDKREITYDTPLPFIGFTFPAPGNKPSEYKLDLNTLSPETLATLQPMFEHLANDVCGWMLQAWDNAKAIIDGAHALIQTARNSDPTAVECTGDDA